MKLRTLKSIVLGLWLSLTGCIPNKVDMDKEGNLIFNLHYNEEKSGEYEFIELQRLTLTRSYIKEIKEIFFSN